MQEHWGAWGEGPKSMPTAGVRSETPFNMKLRGDYCLERLLYSVLRFLVCVDLLSPGLLDVGTVRTRPVMDPIGDVPSYTALMGS